MGTNYLDGEIDRSSLENKNRDRKIERHKLADGNNVLRILPPFGTNHNKSAFAEWTLHWGFQDSEGNKKPLVCTYKYEKYCPICEVSRDLYKRKTALIKDYMDAENKKIMWDRVPDEIKVRYTKLNQDWEDLKSNTQFFYNAIDLNHSIKILSLSKMAHDGLRIKMLEAMDKYGIAPASLNAGCYFVISKIKTGPRIRDVKYQVELYKAIEKDSQGGVIERVVRNSLPDAVINGYDKLAYDVHVLYPVRSAADVKKILNGDGSVFDQEKLAKREKGNLNPDIKVAPPAAPPSLPPVEETKMPPQTPPQAPIESDMAGVTNNAVQLGSSVPINVDKPVNNAAPQTTIDDLKKMLGY